MAFISVLSVVMELFSVLSCKSLIRYLIVKRYDRNMGKKKTKKEGGTMGRKKGNEKGINGAQNERFKHL